MSIQATIRYIRARLTSKAGKELLSKLVFPIGLFMSIMLVGVVGYSLIENYTFLESVYITAITVSTVGYGEVRPLSDEGRIFTIFLVMLNLCVFTYVVALFTQYLADGRYIKSYKLLKMENRISQLRNHVIICGFGRNGKQVSQILNDNSIPFVLLEKDESKTTGQPGLKYFMNSDATQDETLIDAGIKHARAIVSTLPLDTDNLFVVLTAKQLNPGIKIISRASNDSSVNKLKIAGASNVIMPDKIGGAHMASLVMIPDVVEVLSLLSTRNNSEFKVVEICAEKEINLGSVDIWRKSGCTILAIKKTNGDYTLNPAADTSVATGDSLIMMGSDKQVQEARKLVG